MLSGCTQLKMDRHPMPKPFGHATGAGIDADLAHMTADRDRWRDRAVRAEAGLSVAASARRLQAKRRCRVRAGVGRGLFDAAQ